MNAPEPAKPYWPLPAGRHRSDRLEQLTGSGLPAWVGAALAILTGLACGRRTYKTGYEIAVRGHLNINALMSIAVRGVRCY